MPQPIASVSLAQLREARFTFQAEEAVAVVLAAGERLSWRIPAAPFDVIRLCNDGRIELHDEEGALPCTAAPFATLLHALLPQPGQGGAGRVAGGIRMLIARATGQTELPPVVSVHQFAATLRRFAPPSTTHAIASAVARWTAGVPEPAPPAVPLSDERRARGPSLTEMREFLREADLERYVLTRQLETRDVETVPAPPDVDDRDVRRTSERPIAWMPTAELLNPDPPPRRHGRKWVVAVAVVLLLLSGAAIAGGLRGVPSSEIRDRWDTLAQEWGPRAHDTWMRSVRAVGLASSPTAPPETTSRASSAPSAIVPSPTPAAPGPTVLPAPPPEAVTEPEEPPPGRHDVAAAATTEPIDHAAPATAADVPVAAASSVWIPALEPLRTALSPAYSPSFGADERVVYFHSDDHGASRLIRADTDRDGDVIRQATLIDNGARNYHVRPSPNGRLLAFDSDQDGPRGIYVADADGRNVRRVSGSGYAAVPTWAPDSSRMAILRAEPDEPSVWNLWLLDLQSRDQHRLTRYRSGQAWPGTWFSDGERLTYTHETALFVLDVASGALHAYSSPVPGRLVRTAAVAPDDRHVVFQVYRDGVWILDVGTGRMRRVLADPSAEEFSWSQDGQRIAFHSRRDGRWGVWLMDSPVDQRR